MSVDDDDDDDVVGASVVRVETPPPTAAPLVAVEYERLGAVPEMERRGGGKGASLLSDLDEDELVSVDKLDDDNDKLEAERVRVDGLSSKLGRVVP